MFLQWMDVGMVCHWNQKTLQMNKNWECALKRLQIVDKVLEVPVKIIL